MPDQPAEQRRLIEGLSRDALELLQLSKLNALLARTLPDNGFYRSKLGSHPLPLPSLAEFQSLPFTRKSELVSSDGEFAANRTYPLEQYVRFHRTSGTHGRPLIVLDTQEDWQWWLDTWQYTLDAAGLDSHDRVFMAFSFGPFIGFWSAHDAALARGALVIPGGGLSSTARLEILRSLGITALFCTPSYALHLAEVASQHRLNPADFGVRKVVVAGEPGGSLPVLRDRLEQSWNAQVIDHAGATEIGPWGFSDPRRRGLRIVESEFIAEFLTLDDQRPAADQELSELVLTTLGRPGCPVIRYRTGDLVRPRRDSHGFVLLEGGVLGRVDDMLIIRGVNVFPTAVESILRAFPEIDEFRLVARKVGELDELEIEVEDRRNDPDRILAELQLRLGLRVQIRCVPCGSLPRFEGKAKRFHDQRNHP